MSSNRLFVGNLSFSTTAENLGKLFETVGEVQEAVIVARGQFSRGYGFVTMKNAADAHKAVAELNNRDLDGRTIRIEESRSTGPHPPGQRPPTSRGGRGGRGGRGRGGRGRGFGLAPRAPRGGRPRQPRRSNFDPNAPIEPNRLHLKNLPYSLKDEDLKKEFAGYNITDAVIIRAFNGRSYGYGFVQCADDATSKKILEECKDKQIGGRTITISQARVKRERPAAQN